MNTSVDNINIEEILMQIGVLRSQIDRAEWEIGRICNKMKASLNHGEFTDFATQAFRVLHISLATIERYMRLNREFPQPIAQQLNVSALYALMRKNVPEPVREFCIDAQVANVPVIDYIARAYERRGISDTWQELTASKSVALDGESIPVSELTARDLKYMENERRAVFAQAQTEYRFTAYFEDVQGARATLVISGGVDDLAKLAGREGVVLLARVKD